MTQLQFLLELAHQELMYYQNLPASMLTGKRKTAAYTLKSLAFIQWLEKDKSFLDQIKKRKISWQADNDSIKKAFHHLKNQEVYKTFTQNAEQSKYEEMSALKWLMKEFFSKTEFIPHVLEEKNIYWAETIELVERMVVKTGENGKNTNDFQLLPLYKDAEDDVQFMQDLVQKTIRDDSYFHQLIADKTKNWDAERIAIVDIILMNMALCEIINLSSIPIKFSLNEYIDISKDYSTPNSKSFINGVIDKLVIELKKEGKIQKTGRGLKE